MVNSTQHDSEAVFCLHQFSQLSSPAYGWPVTPFDSYDDSGQIDTFTVEPDSASIDDDLWSKLDEFLMAQLPGGWEDNDGAFGEFKVDVASGAVEVTATRRIEAEADAKHTRWKWRR